MNILADLHRAKMAKRKARLEMEMLLSEKQEKAFLDRVSKLEVKKQQPINWPSSVMPVGNDTKIYGPGSVVTTTTDSDGEWAYYPSSTTASNSNVAPILSPGVSVKAADLPSFTYTTTLSEMDKKIDLSKIAELIGLDKHSNSNTEQS